MSPGRGFWPRAARGAAWALLGLVGPALWTNPARAEAPADSTRIRTALPTSLAQWDVFALGSFGRGLRLNNPYRLQTVLGSSPESLSLTAGYADFGLGAVHSAVHGFEQGAVTHLSVAVQGVPQEVLSLSYLARLRLQRWFLTGRVGAPVVIEPDLNVGLELGLGATWLLRAGFGFNAELAASLFYGAATLDRAATTIPIVSAALGVYLEYEVLP